MTSSPSASSKSKAKNTSGPPQCQRASEAGKVRTSTKRRFADFTIDERRRVRELRERFNKHLEFAGPVQLAVLRSGLQAVARGSPAGTPTRQLTLRFAESFFRRLAGNRFVGVALMLLASRLHFNAAIRSRTFVGGYDPADSPPRKRDQRCVGRQFCVDHHVLCVCPNDAVVLDFEVVNSSTAIETRDRRTSPLQMERFGNTRRFSRQRQEGWTKRRRKTPKTGMM